MREREEDCQQALGIAITRIVTVAAIKQFDVVGHLPQRKVDVNDCSELVLLITPRIISNPAMGAQVSGELVRPLSVQSW